VRATWWYRAALYLAIPAVIVSFLAFVLGNQTVGIAVGLAACLMALTLTWGMTLDSERSEPARLDRGDSE
jgi:hypothetical protein